MKVMGLERDNTTLPSTPDPRGWRYSASFELYPFHEGKDRAVYKGLLNGQGPKRGWFCVVKAGLDGAGTCDDWRHVQEAVRRAHELAKSFNALVQAPAITFQWPLVAEMEAVSDFTPLVKLFRPHDKKLHKGEMVIIEDFLEGPFQTFSSSVGWVSPDSRTDVTQAFSHYTWHATRELVVCGLQGVACGWGFRLTTPTIHSRCRGRYGQSDGGVAGIAEFFSSHRCNNICCSWPGPDVPDMKKVGGLEGEEGGEERGGGGLRVHSFHPLSTTTTTTTATATATTTASRNQPRRNHPHHQHRLNVFVPPRGGGESGVGGGGAAQVHTDYIPRVPSAPTFETTRF